VRSAARGGSHRHAVTVGPGSDAVAPVRDDKEGKDRYLLAAMTNPVLVEVTRGNRVESIHRGSVAVVDVKGATRLALGDVETPVYPRSALKPIQAIPLVETGAAAAFGLGDEEIALAAASHSSEPMHTERIAGWLERIGCTVADFACGAHRPAHEPTLFAMIREGRPWTALHNNCSGKHAGFMTDARHLGVPVAGYQTHHHPVQRRVEETLKEMAGLSGDLPWGIDGCTVPNFAAPLRALARAMAAIADPHALPPGRARAAGRVLAAMTSHPELVAGTGRPCTLLMHQSRRVAVKTGAEGVYVAILPELGLGAALKIDDGAGRAAETAMAALLIGLGVLPDVGAAAALARAAVLNTRGVAVGERRATSALLH
jgi:L-asparaginase II